MATALSLSDAATATGVAKSTIFRAIKSGKLSAGRDADGHFAIQAAELFRVYPPVAPVADMAQAAMPDATPDATDLRRRNEQLETEISHLRAMLADMREDRAAWRSQAERLALPRPVEEPSVRRSFWWPFRRAG